ncbi:MAG: acyl carrier protein [Deltaproteobacteria bacterium]|nr:acyl carrier protein [Deltaproteobacteria bacterium]
MPSTLERVQKVVASVLRVPRERVVPGAVLSELAELDSLSLAEIASGLDDEFRTHVPGDDLATVLSIADLVRMVERSVAR